MKAQKFKEVLITITGMCNLDCHYCNLTYDKKCLSLEEIKTITEKHGKDSYYIISGGEPTLHRDFEAILKYLESNGYKGQVITNGYMIGEYIHLFDNFNINLSLSSMNHLNFIEKDYMSWNALFKIANNHVRKADGLNLSIVFNNSFEDMKMLLDFAKINRFGVTFNIPTLFHKDIESFYHSSESKINKCALINTIGYYNQIKIDSWWIDTLALLTWESYADMQTYWKCDYKKGTAICYFPKNGIVDHSLCAIANVKTEQEVKDCKGCLDICRMSAELSS